MSWLQHTSNAWQKRPSCLGTASRPAIRVIPPRSSVRGSKTWLHTWPAGMSVAARWPTPPSSCLKRTTRRRVIEAFKTAQRERLVQLCAAAALAEPDMLADELFLLLEG